MEKEKNKKVHFNKSGTGGITPKLNLPKKWLDDMGVTEDENEVRLKYGQNKKRIVITKKER